MMNRASVLIAVSGFAAAVVSFRAVSIFATDLLILAGMSLILRADRLGRGEVARERWFVTRAEGMQRFVLPLALESTGVILATGELVNIVFRRAYGQIYVLVVAPVALGVGMMVGLLIWNDAEHRHPTR